MCTYHIYVSICTYTLQCSLTCIQLVHACSWKNVEHAEICSRICLLISYINMLCRYVYESTSTCQHWQVYIHFIIKMCICTVYPSRSCDAIPCPCSLSFWVQELQASQATSFNWGPRGQLAATFLGVWRQAIQCRRHQARVEALSRKDLAGRVTKRHTVTERWEMRTIVPTCFPELPLHRCIIKLHQPLLTKLNITSEMRTEKRDGIGSYLTSMMCNDLNKYPCHSTRQLPQHIVAKGSGRGWGSGMSQWIRVDLPNSFVP